MSDLVGQKFNLKESTFIYGKGGGQVVRTRYELDDPEMEAKIRDMFGENVRIFPPGTAGTTDWKPFRTNVHISKDGIITDVRAG